MENSRKYQALIILLCVLASCTRPPQSAYKTNAGKTKQKYYNALYLGDRESANKYGKKLNKKRKK